jgi:hypothetical protein
MTLSQKSLVTIFIVTAIAALVATSLGQTLRLSQKWDEAFFKTVVLFVSVIVVSKPLWQAPGYWKKIFFILVLHCLLLGSFLWAFIGSDQHLWLYLTAAMILEGSLIVIVLLKGVPDDQLPN